MPSRRHFLRFSALSIPFFSAVKNAFLTPNKPIQKPKAIVVSTWDSGLPVNVVAWKTIQKADGRALDRSEERRVGKEC